jgi:hypothetical protein
VNAAPQVSRLSPLHFLSVVGMHSPEHTGLVPPVQVYWQSWSTIDHWPSTSQVRTAGLLFPGSVPHFWVPGTQTPPQLCVDGRHAGVPLGQTVLAPKVPFPWHVCTCVLSAHCVVPGEHEPQPTPSMQATAHVVSPPHDVPPVHVCATLPTQRLAFGLHEHFLGVAALPPQVKPLSHADEQVTCTAQLFGTVALQSSPGSPEQVVPSGSWVQQVWSVRQSCPAALQATPPFPAAEQSTLNPQRSVIDPHLPAQSVVTARAQTQTCAVESQVQFAPWVVAQVSPQLTGWPQLSMTVPQWSWHAVPSGTQALHSLPAHPYVHA